jgi:hypothetical protein
LEEIMGRMIDWRKVPGATLARWEFDAETFTLQPGTAPIDALERALADCYCCIATEYPETAGGTYAALGRQGELEAALTARFGDAGAAAIARARAEGNTQSKVAHPR